jgi:hypothetical protein
MKIFHRAIFYHPCYRSWNCKRNVHVCIKVSAVLIGISTLADCGLLLCVSLRCFSAVTSAIILHATCNLFRITRCRLIFHFRCRGKECLQFPSSSILIPWSRRATEIILKLLLSRAVNRGLRFFDLCHIADFLSHRTVLDWNGQCLPHLAYLRVRLPLSLRSSTYLFKVLHFLNSAAIN